ncbi:MAG: hypothetical protein PHD15_04970 [Clostridia bacterium]|nr:hypothetical protein [Clostridia bacterium]MDD4387092.1 hypothetical protein [Clostridia bacterium]
MAGKTKCEELGYKCTMENRLSEENVPVYRYETRPAGGVDRRPGDTVQVAVGSPIRQEKKYIAARVCSHCGYTETIGTKQVSLNTIMTFSDFFDEEAKKEEYRDKLMKFDEKQREEREKYISENEPK